MKGIFVVIFLFIGFVVPAKVNNDAQNIDETDTLVSEFSFVVAGHLYGSPTSTSLFPSSHIISFTEEINELKPTFVMLLGDNYRQQDNSRIVNFKNSFLDKVSFPVFNAVGNHDLADEKSENNQNYAVYRELFGNETYYSFQRSNSLFIILDSEQYLENGKSNGSIKGEQLTFLRNEISQLQPSIKNVFICVHKELNLWSDNNYESEIKPLFKSKSLKDVSVYILSGDMEKFSNDLYVVNDDNVTYVHTHISDSENDKFLLCEVSREGEVAFVPISLTKEEVGNIDEYSEIKSEELSTFQKFVKTIRNNIIGILSLVLILIGFVMLRAKKK